MFINRDSSWTVVGQLVDTAGFMTRQPMAFKPVQLLSPLFIEWSLFLNTDYLCKLALCRPAGPTIHCMSISPSGHHARKWVTVVLQAHSQVTAAGLGTFCLVIEVNSRICGILRTFRSCALEQSFWVNALHWTAILHREGELLAHLANISVWQWNDQKHFVTDYNSMSDGVIAWGIADIV